jgi:S1-C subfamily serine protease
MLMLTASAALALDPAIEDLRSELRRLFPPPAGAVHAAPAAREPVDPYTIIRRDYLLARPAELTGQPMRVSLRTIRQYPAPLRQAHAACVKILTPYWHGSGVLISSSGDILTSYHLVAGALTASAQTMDGRIHPISDVKAYSALHDLAIVHIDGGPFPMLSPRAEPAPSAGTRLFVVGHPGELAWKLTEGRVIRHTADAGTHVLHFESDVARGNSGGPVIDAEGRLCAITACAAELADGTHVKVGIAAEALVEFLSTRPGTPIDLPSLAETERNRQTADFLQVIFGLTEDLMTGWQSAMAAVDVEVRPLPYAEASVAPAIAVLPLPGGTAVRQAPAVAFVNTRHCAETAMRLLIFQALLRRCAAAEGLSPELQQSMRDYVAVLDHMVEAAALLSRRPATPGEARLKMQQAADHRLQAERRFGTAVTMLQGVGRTFGLDAAAPQRYADLEHMRRKYAPAGSRMQTGGLKGPI